MLVPGTDHSAFMHSKPCMQPLYVRSERGSRTRMFLFILGYTIMAMIASMTGMTYEQTEKIISGIKGVVYINRSHSVVELKKSRRNSWRRFPLNCSGTIGQR